MVSGLSPREHDLEALLRLRIQARDVLRLLLEIAVHHDCPPSPTLCEPGRDRRVLPEVAAQPYRAYCRINGRKGP